MLRRVPAFYYLFIIFFIFYLFVNFLALSKQGHSKLRLDIRFVLFMLRKSKEILQTKNTRFKLLMRPGCTELSAEVLCECDRSPGN